jgi:hypothetical protein
MSVSRLLCFCYTERAALTKRHSVRLYAEELALARCNKSFEAYQRCAGHTTQH